VQALIGNIELVHSGVIDNRRMLLQVHMLWVVVVAQLELPAASCVRQAHSRVQGSTPNRARGLRLMQAQLLVMLKVRVRSVRVEQGVMGGLARHRLLLLIR